MRLGGYGFPTLHRFVFCWDKMDEGLEDIYIKITGGK